MMKNKMTVDSLGKQTVVVKVIGSPELFRNVGADRLVRAGYGHCPAYSQHGAPCLNITKADFVVIERTA